MGYFVFKKVEPKSGVMRDVHKDVLGRRCCIIDVTIGERAWIGYEPEPGEFHRLHTSSVVNYEEADDGSWIKIETKNTNYTLEYVAE